MEDIRRMKRDAAMSLLGCCGLYCGLCSKYQSKAPSRCLGCRLGEQHSWCSIWSCCVKRHGLETCAECSSVFTCAIYLRRGVADWIPAGHNLRRIGALGPERVIQEQEQRRALLERMLRDFNEGRSMSFYCRACATMPIDRIKEAIRAAKRRLAAERADRSDLRARAKAVKTALSSGAFCSPGGGR